VKIELLSENLWNEIKRLSKTPKRKYLAVAYIGRGASKFLCLTKGDSILVDMSERSVKNSQTDPWEIEKYYKKGVAVFNCANLHAKIYVLGNTVIIGSANLSKHSQMRLIESGLLCRDKNVVSSAIGLIKALQVENVTTEYIKLCKKWYKPPQFLSEKKTIGKNTTKVFPKYSRLWVTGVDDTTYSELEEQLNVAEKKKAEKVITDKKKYEAEPLKWYGNSSFTREIKKGDLLIQMYDNGKTVRVYPDSRVIHVKRYKSFDKRKAPRMFIYIESQLHPKTIIWKEFKKVLTAVGLTKLGSGSTREIKSPPAVYRILGLWRKS
jgi:hypothetical protein